MHKYSYDNEIKKAYYKGFNSVLVKNAQFMSTVGRLAAKPVAWGAKLIGAENFAKKLRLAAYLADKANILKKHRYYLYKATRPDINPYKKLLYEDLYQNSLKRLQELDRTGSFSRVMNKLSPAERRKFISEKLNDPILSSAGKWALGTTGVGITSLLGLNSLLNSKKRDYDKYYSYANNPYYGYAPYESEFNNQPYVRY